MLYITLVKRQVVTVADFNTRQMRGRSGKVQKSILTEILHHSQLAVGAGSPVAFRVADRLNKPALPHEKSPDRIAARSQF
jgi:hypothetical protein